MEEGGGGGGCPFASKLPSPNADPNANPFNYGDYLQVDKLLSCQAPESEKHGKPAHEEMLFIIIHQTYELWFKQILTDLQSVLEIMNVEYLDDKRIGTVVSRLERIVAIQKILVSQIQVLETMTPIEFLEFRAYLTPASGFQSLQFRLIEIKLGLEQANRLLYQKNLLYFFLLH